FDMRFDIDNQRVNADGARGADLREHGDPLCCGSFDERRKREWWRGFPLPAWACSERPLNVFKNIEPRKGFGAEIFAG
ncbi:MAG: hypothetical protein ABIR47_00095, partial [Candidatus Kapaibacterium sp.]